MDKNGLVTTALMMMMMCDDGDDVIDGEDNIKQHIIPRHSPGIVLFLLLSTRPHTSGVRLLSTQLSLCLPPPPPHLPALRCVCPTSSPLWRAVMENPPNKTAYNPILSVTHRQEVLQGKERVRRTLTDTH